MAATPALVLARRLIFALVLAGSSAAGATYAFTLVNCGGESEGRCSPGDPEYVLNGEHACDFGLRFAILQGLCVNDTRRIAEVDPWTDWALRNQEVLAIDEPINWVSRLGTHNAFNAWQDGYLFPNQWWSMTDQLRLGSRHFELDLHLFNSAVRLCHGREGHLGCGLYDRLYAYGMKEIRNWLAREPDQILTIDFEDRSEGEHAAVNDPIAEYLGSMTYTPAMRALLPNNRLPTFREMIAANKRFLVFDPQDTHGSTWIHSNLAFNFPSGTLVDKDGNAAPGNLKLDPLNQDCVTGVLTNNPDSSGVPQGFAVFASDNRNLFSWVAEDRVFGPSGSEVTHSVVERAVRCGIGVVFLDDYANSSAFDNPSPNDFRHWSGIWSWEPGDAGNHGDAAVLKAQKTVGIGPWKRWNSRNTTEAHRYLCGRPRSESGGDPVTWPDRVGSSWKVTTIAGPWSEGGLRCLEEFGADWVFRAPVSGYQNVQASIVAEGLGDIWLNYNDIKSEEKWVINKRPFAVAGPDQVLQCTGTTGAVAHLDASASNDPENDALRFRWTGDAGFSSSPTRNVIVQVGTQSFDLVVDDHFSGVRTDSVQVKVEDTSAPTIHSVVPSRATLWPPNGKMLPVSLKVDATDVCSANLNCRIVSVVTNEANPQRGSSVNNGLDAELTSPLSVLLRAERLGSSGGRTYTITVRCTDAAGNSTDKAVTVTVPHDQK